MATVTDVLTRLPREPETSQIATCGTCGRSWDDGIVTGITPAPSARCPFEDLHEEEPSLEPTTIRVRVKDGRITDVSPLLPGVRVEVYDYDTEGADESFIATDENGEPCFIETYEAGPSHLLATLKAIVHELEHGEASEGDLEDIRWCAAALAKVLGEEVTA